MLFDLAVSFIWWVVRALMPDFDFVTPEFLGSFKTAVQALGPIITAISPLTFVIPFEAVGIMLNFVIAAWLLYWPVRLIRWLLEWTRGKS